MLSCQNFHSPSAPRWVKNGSVGELLLTFGWACRPTARCGCLLNCWAAANLINEFTLIRTGYARAEFGLTDFEPGLLPQAVESGRTAAVRLPESMLDSIQMVYSEQPSSSDIGPSLVLTAAT